MTTKQRVLRFKRQFQNIRQKVAWNEQIGKKENFRGFLTLNQPTTCNFLRLVFCYMTIASSFLIQGTSLNSNPTLAKVFVNIFQNKKMTQKWKSGIFNLRFKVLKSQMAIKDSFRASWAVATAPGLRLKVVSLSDFQRKPSKLASGLWILFYCFILLSCSEVLSRHFSVTNVNMKNWG